MIFFAIGGAVILAVYVYLAWWPAGRVVTGQVGPYPVAPRIVLGSPVAYVVRFLRGKGKNDPPSGITLFGRIHVTRGASAFLLCHEMSHWVTGEKIGHHRYLWRYLTRARFRAEEESEANIFAIDYHTDGYFDVLT